MKSSGPISVTCQVSGRHEESFQVWLWDALAAVRTSDITAPFHFLSLRRERRTPPCVMDLSIPVGHPVGRGFSEVPDKYVWPNAYLYQLQATLEGGVRGHC